MLVADAEPQVAAAFQLFDLALAAAGRACSRSICRSCAFARLSTGCFYIGPFFLGFRLVILRRSENRLPDRICQRTEDLARGRQIAFRDMIHERVQLLAIGFAGVQFRNISLRQNLNAQGPVRSPK